MITIYQRYRQTDKQTDGRTDRQTDDMRSQIAKLVFVFTARCTLVQSAKCGIAFAIRNTALCTNKSASRGKNEHQFRIFTKDAGVT